MGIDRQLGPAAGAIDFDGRWDRRLVRHAGILRHIHAGVTRPPEKPKTGV
jgi:hypothetical protein